MKCYVKILFIGTGSNIFFRAEALKKINGFDESYLRHQDIETLVRFFKEKNNKILGVDEILVVKIGDDSMNPNIDKAIKFKEKFLEDFKIEIDSFKNKEYIYWVNYSNLIGLAIQNKSYNKIEEIKKHMRIYCKYGVKNKIRNLIYFFNNYIPIKEIKHCIYDINSYIQLNQELINKMREIENTINDGGTNEKKC